MKHRKIEKIILNFFRLLPILCILIFLLYVCLTGFKKEKTNTYDTTNIEQVTEEVTIYTYDLDILTETSTNLTHYTTWDFNNYTGDIYFLKTDFIYNALSGGTYSDAFYEGSRGLANVYLDDNKITIYNDHEDYDLIELSIDYIEYDNYYIISVVDFTFNFNDWDYNNGFYLLTDVTITYTDNYTIVNKIKYYMNDYVFKYTDTLFNSGINTPFNAFTNAISLNQYSIFYSYLKFSYLYLIYLLLIDFIYLFYNIIAFIPKWLVNEFEKRT